MASSVLAFIIGLGGSAGAGMARTSSGGTSGFGNCLYQTAVNPLRAAHDVAVGLQGALMNKNQPEKRTLGPGELFENHTYVIMSWF